MEEAVVLLRELHKEDPAEVYSVALAASLYDLGVLLLNIHVLPDAAYVTIEAIELLEELYSANPDKHRADLANSLYSLGAMYAEIRVWEGARDCTSRAALLRMRLYEIDPDTHLPQLTSSLSNLGLYLMKSDQWEEARDTLAYSIELRKLLYGADPDAHRANLISGYNRLATSLRNLGDWSAAVKADADAVSLFDITGQIQLLDQPSLGHGAFGTVYEARWINPVAMRYDPQPRTDRVRPHMSIPVHFNPLVLNTISSL